MRVREDPERYSAKMQSECGRELPSSDEIYDNLLCFAFKNSAGSHPISFTKEMNIKRFCVLTDISIFRKIYS